MTFTIYDNDLNPTSVGEKSADATYAFSPSAAIPVDKLAILGVAWDNISTTNADDTTNLTVTDDAGSNTWIRAAEAQYCLSSNNPPDGCLAGVYYCVVTTQIETTSTITITAASATATYARANKLCAFNRDIAKTIEVAGKGYERIAASTAYSATVSGLTSEEHLWFGLNAIESPNTTNTRDASYSALTANTSNQAGTSGGANTENQSLNTGYLISTGTTETYDNTAQANVDRVSILVAFREVVSAAATRKLQVTVSPRRW